MPYFLLDICKLILYNKIVVYLSKGDNMLYNKKNDKFSDELFKNPTSEYRGTPFWAWNCKLEPELLKKEIEYMKEMGFGGFHMHPRVGLATEYLSEEYMDCIKACVEKAKDEKMLAWLYDEDKWPSGYAGGIVTKDVENRAKYLLFTKVPFDDGSLSVEEDIAIATKYLPNIKYYFEACYDVNVDEDGHLVSYKRIDLAQKAEYTKWFAYISYADDSTWYNGQSYVDTLSKDAIKNFINITHEKYKENIGKDFGSIVPAIFTDEPQFSGMGRLSSPITGVNVGVAYTPELKDFYFKKYGECIFDVLPEVFIDYADIKPTVRYRYYDAVAELFAQAFADQIGKWCDDNGIYMTGHLMEEPSLQSQTNMVGDAMRSYRGFGIPGIDLLVNSLELTTAKQCQSAAHQYGREGMLSELYGVTGWKFDFKGHKYQGDWQAALGVTVRVPHLFWVSMSGEAKRDYPASIGYQSPWYKEYKYVEDHFARVNTALTRGKPVVNVGVIHPVESYWIACGSLAHSKHIREDLENCFSSITNWLLDENLDFNYICESTLDAQSTANDNGFGVGAMNYSAVVVPSLLTIRSTTLEKLEDFALKGGKIIFMGRIPTYVDAIPSDRAAKLAQKCTVIPWAKDQLVMNLEAERVVSINGGRRALYQLRDDGDCKYLFMCSKNQLTNIDDDVMCRRHVAIKGTWQADILDTIKGERLPLAVSYKNGNTEFDWVCGAYDSLLLELRNGQQTEGYKFTEDHFTQIEYLQSKVDYTLSEPNVLVLDCPKYSMNGAPLSEPNEMLRIDDAIRDSLGIRKRAEAMVQPWVTPIDTTPIANIKLVFDIESEIEYEGAQLAMESMQFSTVTFNGQNVPTIKTGYYIDEDSIHTIALPTIKKGTNVLEIELAFCDACALESYYLLGNFGVQLNGRFAKIVPIADKLAFGAVESQTLPFYGANITYHLTYEGKLDKVLEIQKFAGSAISVEVDGKRVDGMIAYPPHRLHLKAEGNGKHTIDVTLYGNRANTLNALHNTNQRMVWYGPNGWHPSDNNFSFEYEIATNGIITTPRLLSK